MIHLNEKGVEDLQKFKDSMDRHFKKGKKFRIYEEIKKMKWNSPDVHGLYLDEKIVRRFENGGRGWHYEWVGEEPSVKMLKYIKKANSEHQKNRKKAIARKKQQELDNLKSSPDIFSGTPEQTIKEPQQEIKPAPPVEQKPAEKQSQEIEVQEVKSKIPITVDVSTDGETKTVTIKIVV